MLVWLPWGGTLAALGCLWGAMRAARKKHLIDGLPTCKTTGVFIGLVEVKGTAEVGEPLTSVLAAVRCVHYSWIVEERWSRLVTGLIPTATARPGRASAGKAAGRRWRTAGI